METYSTYKGFGIRYFAGTTKVEKNGLVLKTIRQKGEIAGKQIALDAIDILVRWY